MPGHLPGPDDDDGYAIFREQLVAEFERLLPPDDPDLDPGDLGLLLDWKRAYGDGRLDRWRRRDLEGFLLDWFPAKVSATADDVRGTPRTIAFALGFLARQSLLAAGSDDLDVLLPYTVGLQDAFLTAMDDPANFGMAKSLFAGLDLGDDDLTPESLEAALVRFNALPQAERAARTGGPLPGPPLEDVVIGPVVLPDDEALRTAAQESPTLTTFIRLSEYFAAPGRPLTKVGNLRLADARALVDLLGTGDTFRERGTEEWQGSTRSASQLPVLDQWKWWAVEAGVLRVRQGRLVAVEAWRRRARTDPLREVLRALQLLADFGPLRSERWWLVDAVVETLDTSLGPLLSRLLATPRGLDYAEIGQEWRTMLVSVGVPEWYPGQVAGDFSAFVDVLERVGVVVHHDKDLTETGTGRRVRTGGSLVLSPIGVRFAVDLVRQEGLTVQVTAAPEAQTVEGLVVLAVQVDLETWWQVALAWLAAQPDDDAALRALLVALDGADDPALLLLALQHTPVAAAARLVPSVRRLALTPGEGSTDLSRVAAVWVDQHGGFAEGEIDEEALLVGGMVTLGRLASSSPELVTEALAADTGGQDPFGFVRMVGQLMPPYAVELLEAIGRAFPDKAVAKAARKELFRVRSRLVQRGPR